MENQSPPIETAVKPASPSDLAMLDASYSFRIETEYGPRYAAFPREATDIAGAWGVGKEAVLEIRKDGLYIPAPKIKATSGAVAQEIVEQDLMKFGVSTPQEIGIRIGAFSRTVALALRRMKKLGLVVQPKERYWCLPGMAPEMGAEAEARILEELKVGGPQTHAQLEEKLNFLEFTGRSALMRMKKNGVLCRDRVKRRWQICDHGERCENI